MAAVREAAVAAGVAPKSLVDDNANGITLPDGRTRITLTFDVDLAITLKQWAEGQQETLSTFLIGVLISYTQMDWGSMAQPATVV